MNILGYGGQNKNHWIRSVPDPCDVSKVNPGPTVTVIKIINSGRERHRKRGEGGNSANTGEQLIPGLSECHPFRIVLILDSVDGEITPDDQLVDLHEACPDQWIHEDSLLDVQILSDIQAQPLQLLPLDRRDDGLREGTPRVARRRCHG